MGKFYNKLMNANFRKSVVLSYTIFLTQSLISTLTILRKAKINGYAID